MNQKSILILFGPTSQTSLVKSLVMNMAEKGIHVDAWNTSTWEYVNLTSNKRLLNHLRLLFEIPKIGTLIHRYLVYYRMKNISDNYDAVDVHFFTPMYFRLLNYFIKTKKIYKITVWGSDFFRVTQQRKEKQKKYYLNAKLIQLETEQIKEEFLKYLPSACDKIRVARFGIYQLKYIDEIIYNNSNYSLPILQNDSLKNKIVITCGYNASKGQQHEKIINALQKLDFRQKNTIFLFFPMTYGIKKGYLNYIENLLQQTKIPYHIFSTHLSDKENSALKVLTDIVVNIQITDTLSASLQEHLYAKNILLAGEWLPYKIYDEANIFYLKTSYNELANNISCCIDNLDVLKEKTKENHLKIKKLSTWETVVPDWTKIYTELLS